MTTVNVPLLRKILDHITAHPEEHDQEVWAERTACGTVMCLAGHAAVMTGHTIAYERRANGDWMVRYCTNGEQIEDVARDALGLTYLQAAKLFDSQNSRDTLWDLAETFTDGQITQL